MVEQVLGELFLLFAIISFIGYIALKEPLVKALSGSIKTAIGVLMMSQGSGLLIRTFNEILEPLKELLGGTGIVLDVYMTMETSRYLLGEYGNWIAYTLLGAFTINILLVFLNKITKIKTVFLSGNVMVIQSSIVTYMVYHFLGTNVLWTVFISSSLLALYWGSLSTILLKPMSKITGTDALSIGHQQMLGSIIAHKVAPLIGREEESVETMSLPTWLKLFDDTIVASAIILSGFATIILLAIGQEAVAELAGDTYWIIYIIKTGLILSVALTILLKGVDLFVDELMISFKGITNKLLPGAAIAVGCTAIFKFSPKAVILGFVGGACGMLFGSLALFTLGTGILIIPTFIPMFFDNGTIGVFANKRGGWKATILLTFISGIIQVVGGSMAANIMSMNVWQGSFDWSTLWLGIMLVLKWIGGLV